MKFSGFIQNLIRGHFNYILTKSLSEFCPCPDNFNGAESESSGLVCLMERISREDAVYAMSELQLDAHTQVHIFYIWHCDGRC